MPIASIPSTSGHSAAAFRSASLKPWGAALGGMVAGGLAVLTVYAVSGPGAGLVLGIALEQAARGNPALAFKMPAGLPDTQILSGISGEALADGSPVKLAATGNASESRDLSPAAMDRLSAGDCISLTMASGQKFSFRIVGARESTRGASTNIDLAVTACSPGSDAVLKAVIESSKPEVKEVGAARSL
jgi:hypothetical protein